jgi:hypothetical protein
MPLPCDSVTILSEGMRSVQVWPDRCAHPRNDTGTVDLALSAPADLDGHNYVLPTILLGHPIGSEQAVRRN